MVVLGGDGRPLDLRKKLGEGGEGSVWVSPVHSDRAIKIYLQPVDASKADKLATMVSVADPPLLQVAAWPSAIVYNSARKPVGFEMPKLTTQRALHEIFGTKSRLQCFPNANWAVLVHAAVNLAAAFANMHGRGIVVGDVNSNNVVIQDDARVHFIDCDSFQISTPSRLFRCEVGVPEYQPPELQGINLSSVDRRPQHDAFGMAVLIFQLLFLGKHPFMGRLPNSNTNAPPIDQNIKTRNYFYDETARRAGLKPPPASLSIDAVTPDVAALFERTFRGDPNDRPTAVEWKGALQRLEAKLIVCRVNSFHRYLGGMPCPWCVMEVHQRIVYFAAPSLIGPSGVIDESVWASFPQTEVDRLWAEIAKVASPNVTFHGTASRSHPAPRPIDEEVRAKGTHFLIVLIVLLVVATVVAAVPTTRTYEWIIAAVGLILWLRRPRGGAEFTARKAALKDAGAAFERAEGEWRRLCDDPTFKDTHTRLDQIRSVLAGQRVAYESELAHVRQTGEHQARERYMDAQLIADAKIKGIGQALTSRLRNWNIESALDVSASVYQVQGIGQAKASALLAWRTTVERQFRFDPKMIDPLLNAVRSRHARQRTQGRNELLIGAQTLRQIASATEIKAYAARGEAIRTRAVLDQAKADMRQMPELLFR